MANHYPDCTVIYRRKADKRAPGTSVRTAGTCRTRGYMLMFFAWTCVMFLSLALFSSSKSESEVLLILLSETHMDATCNGVNDGSIDLTILGGVPPYTIDWDNDGTGDNDDAEDISGLAAGDYTVSVTDALSEVQSITVTISEPTVLASTETNVDVSCFGAANGTIDLSITGGTAPYTIDWDNDGTGDNDDSEDLSGLAPGDYTVLVTDANGWSTGLTVTISEPEDLCIQAGRRGIRQGRGITDQQ